MRLFLVLALSTFNSFAWADPLNNALQKLDIEIENFKIKTEIVSDPLQLKFVLDSLNNPAAAPAHLQKTSKSLINAVNTDNMLQQLFVLRQETAAPSEKPKFENPVTTKTDLLFPQDMPIEIKTAVSKIYALSIAHQALWNTINSDLKESLTDDILAKINNHEPPLEKLTSIEPHWWQPQLKRIDNARSFPFIEQEKLAEEMTKVITDFISWSKSPQAQKTLLQFSRWRLNTPNGLILIGTPGNDTFSEETFLLIDPGGNDLYSIKQNSADETGSSIPKITIDLSGDDTYRFNKSLSCAIFNIHANVDVQGNDIYQNDNSGQGCGIFGIGILEDYSGNDIYSAAISGQGLAAWGTGILIDRLGDDIYKAGHLSQGAGLPLGTGALIDQDGNDTYEAGGYDLDPRGWIEQYGDFKQGRVYQSLSQGFGYGFRDLTAGGIGILIDVSGNDHYNADYLAQGSGYWLGLGLLFDNEGNDRYLARRYAQGAGVHFAAGALIDNSGNDQYISWAVSQGCGHDYALGFLADKSGNDTYSTDPGAFLQIGASNAGGIAMLIDDAGSDQYLANMNNGLGWGSWDEKRQTYGPGIILDNSTKEDYLAQAISSKPWNRLAGEKGAGLWSEHDPFWTDTLSAQAPPAPTTQPHQILSGQLLNERFDRAHLLPLNSKLSEYLAIASAFGEQTDAVSKAKELLYLNISKESIDPYLELLVPHHVYSVLHLEEIFAFLGEKGAALIRQKIQSANEIERARACYFLTQSRDWKNTDILISALHDPSWKVRLQSARAIARLTDQTYLEKIKTLRQSIKDNNSQKISSWLRAEPKTELMILLGALGLSSAEAAQFAPGISQESPPGQQAEAAASIIIDKQSLTLSWLENKIQNLQEMVSLSEHLVPLIHDSDRDVRRWAVVGLDWSNNKNLCAKSEELLHDPDYTVRDAAIKGIVDLGQTCSKTIKKLTKNSDKNIKKRALKILSLIDKKT